MSRGALRRARRMSTSEIVMLHRCPWRWHLRHVRKVERRRQGEAKPATVWGSCYHAAIAALLLAAAFAARPDLAAALDPEAWPTDPIGAALGALADKSIEPGDLLRHKSAQRLAGDIAEEAALAACATAEWLAAAGWLPAWLPLGRGGLPVPAIELRLGADFGDCGSDGRADAVLEGPDGRLWLVDHKAIGQWPESGAALERDELRGVDLRDDLQARIYLLALESRGVRCAGALHLYRRAAAPKPPAISYASNPAHKLHGPSRAKDVESTPELYRAAVEACGKDPADYAAEIERQRDVRWQAWATVDVHPAALRRTLPVLRDACARADAYEAMAPADVPRHPVAGRHAGTCARCPDRALCVAEEREELDAEVEIVGRYSPAADRYPQEPDA